MWRGQSMNKERVSGVPRAVFVIAIMSAAIATVAAAIKLMVNIDNMAYAYNRIVVLTVAVAIVVVIDISFMDVKLNQMELRSPSLRQFLTTCFTWDCRACLVGRQIPRSIIKVWA